KEVLRDIAQESEVTRHSDVGSLDSAPARLPDSRPAALDSAPGALDVAKLKMSVAEVEGLSSEIAALSADHHT
ncbi:hypothetical protein, partial [Enterobacter asburiae]